MYSRATPHPQSEGVYGTQGTAEGFVQDQGVAQFTAAADQYLDLLSSLLTVWRMDSLEAGSVSGQSASEDIHPAPDFSDMDAALAQYCSRRGMEEPRDLETRMNLHVQVIREWIREKT